MITQTDGRAANPAFSSPRFSPDVTPAPQVLLYAAESSSARVAQLLAGELQAAVTSVADGRRCAEVLQHKSFTLVVIEEAIALENEANLKSLYDLAGEAFVLEVNFGLANPARIVRQLRAALARRQNDVRKARTAAMISLQRELSASVSGLLLESQLALRTAGSELAPSLEHLVVLAEVLCQQLRL